MNTDRDNFYDWAKDKPDTTNFSRLDRVELGYRPARAGLPWVRMALIAAFAVGVVLVSRHYFF